MLQVSDFVFIFFFLPNNKSPFPSDLGWHFGKEFLNRFFSYTDYLPLFLDTHFAQDFRVFLSKSYFNRRLTVAHLKCSQLNIQKHIQTISSQTSIVSFESIERKQATSPLDFDLERTQFDFAPDLNASAITQPIKRKHRSNKEVPSLKVIQFRLRSNSLRNSPIDHLELLLFLLPTQSNRALKLAQIKIDYLFCSANSSQVASSSQTRWTWW